MTDTELIGRIVVSINERDLDTLHEETVRAWWLCGRRWGVRSPAAVGCLLDLGRKAWRDPGLVTSSDGSAWMVLTDRTFIAPREVDALVAALEAAP